MPGASIILDNHKIGRIFWSISDGKAVFTASCPFEAGYIYRLCLHCADTSLYLGVMQPDDGRFVLRKTLPLTRISAIISAGAQPVAEITRHLPGQEAAAPAAPIGGIGQKSGFVPLENADIVADNCLKQKIHCKANILYRNDNSAHAIAFPVEIGKSSDFAAFFAAAEHIQSDGANYGLLKLDKTGNICAEFE